MNVYHGSDIIVSHPDIFHSTHNLDFGNGFYVTSEKLQAEQWAKRKAAIHKKRNGYINVYEFRKSSDFQIMNFDDDLDTWMDFVCACRDGSDIYKKYNVIIGKVADDKVSRVVYMYKSKNWDKTRAIKEIQVYKTYNQTAFVTQRAIDTMLTFKEYYEVSV